MAKNSLEKGFEAQAQSLRQFGYPDVTAEMVASAYADWKAGREPADVIAHFCVSTFAEHPWLFGEPQS